MKTAAGKGTCVGSPLARVRVEIIPITEEIIPKIEATQFLPPFEMGEIVVTSPAATPGYFQLPDQTRSAKIEDQGTLWHRMGDVGYKDDRGRLWFCGRKAHVIIADSRSHFPIPMEAIFNQHPEVKRSALVQLNSDPPRPAMVIERKDGKTHMGGDQRQRFFTQLLEMAKQYDHTKMIRDLFLHKDFPVDVRHNIKIDRKKLTQWVNR